MTTHYQLFQLEGNERKFVSAHATPEEAINAATTHFGGELRAVVNGTTSGMQLIPVGQTVPKYSVVDSQPTTPRTLIRE